MHSQTEVVYRWRLPSGDEQLSHVRADNGITRGIPASWCAAVVLQHRLEEAAAEAQRQWRVTVKDRNARQRCTCTYLGRRTAQRDNACVQKVIDWPESTSRHSHETVTFRWQDAAGATRDRDVVADKAWRRGLRTPPLTDHGTFDEAASQLTRPPSADLPGRMQAAALKAQERWAAWVLAEHG